MSTSQQPPANLPSSIGEFIVLGHIGQGQLGEVYLGTHATTGESVALQFINDAYVHDNEFIERFTTVHEALLTIDHPNIAKIYGYGQEGNYTYLASELVNGARLASIQKERGALFEADVLAIVIQIAQGLAFVNDQTGLIHRDISPQTIIIEQQEQDNRDGKVMCANDRAKIIDFGLVSVKCGNDNIVHGSGKVQDLTYMSPEQIRNDAGIDFHADMYALGATMHHLLTGHKPFPGEDPAEVSSGHLESPPPDPGEKVSILSQLTRQIVMVAMAKRPRDRFRDYVSLISACEKALQGLNQNPGTVRFLRKPMVKGGIAQESAAPQQPLVDDEGDIWDAPMDRAVGRIDSKDPKSRTNTHRKSASTGTAQQFKSTTNIGGEEALESKNKTVKKPAAPTTTRLVGSEALRRVVTDKFEKVRTTTRLRRQQGR